MAEPYLDEKTVKEIRAKFKKRGQKWIDEVIDFLTELKPYLDPLIKWRKGGIIAWLAEKWDGWILNKLMDKLIETLYKLKEVI